jgi:hypothetical protein
VVKEVALNLDVVLARYLYDNDPTKAVCVAAALGVVDARPILYRDVYGWFERPSRGVYAISPRGRREIGRWPVSSSVGVPTTSLAEEVGWPASSK